MALRDPHQGNLNGSTPGAAPLASTGRRYGPTSNVQRKIRRNCNATTQMQRKKFSFALRAHTPLEATSVNLQRMQRKIRTLETFEKEK
jgi:hypothetical protein